MVSQKQYTCTWLNGDTFPDRFHLHAIVCGERGGILVFIESTFLKGIFKQPSFSVQISFYGTLDQVLYFWFYNLPNFAWGLTYLLLFKYPRLTIQSPLTPHRPFTLPVATFNELHGKDLCILSWPYLVFDVDDERGVPERFESVSAVKESNEIRR